MDAKHQQHFVSKILKILCRICVFCCKKYPIPICILLTFFVSYVFFPSVFTFLTYAFPLAGFSFLVYRVFSGIDRQNVKQVVEEDDRKKKFAKSRRSFKSRSQLVRRNVVKNSNDYDMDDIFSKSLMDLLVEKKPKETQEIDFKSSPRKSEGSSSNVNIDKDELEPQDKAVRWLENDQKNVMDLGLSEAERNMKRLESLMVRRRSRKDLGYEEGASTKNNNSDKISAIKTRKINPFLEHSSSGKKSPGSAPCSWLTERNPFDLPYDPHEEKLDLTGDIYNFQEDFNLGHQKEHIFCRHESFSLGGFSHPEIVNDKHEMSFYGDPATKQKSFMGLGTSTVELDKEEGESSKQLDGIHHKEDESERKTKESDASSTVDESEIQNTDSYQERKADIVFFYGGNKRIGHAPSHSMVSDLQVEISDQGSGRDLDDLDLSEADLEVVKEDQEKENEMLDLEPVDKQPVSETNHAHGSSESSAKSVLQRNISTDVNENENDGRP